MQGCCSNAWQPISSHESRKGTGTSRAATQVDGPRLAVVGGNEWGRQVARNKAGPVACRWGKEETVAGLWGLQCSHMIYSNAQAWGNRAWQAHTRG